MRAVIGLSGGVDSAVAAALLKRDGYEVLGVHLGAEDGPEAEAAAGTAEALDIELRFFDHREALRDCVITPFEAAWRNGLTPNPCVDCNRLIKFKILFDYAAPDGIAVTGHYACAEDGAIYQGPPGRDQSYVLWRLRRSWLGRLRFPLNGMSKEETRRLAAELGLAAAGKKDSMDLCFTPELPVREWEIRDTEGRLLGYRTGYFTPGQRRGLGVVSHTRLYVTAVDAAANRVTVGTLEAAQKTRLFLKDTHTLLDLPRQFEADVKIRSAGAAVPALVELLDADSASVSFSRPVLGGAPGQSAVWYSPRGRLLGGGKIADRRDGVYSRLT